MDEKPSITRKEVSWHATVAAIRARKQAEALGMDPDVQVSMLHAAATEGGRTGAMPMVTLGTLWALRATEPHLAALCEDDADLDQLFLCHLLLHAEDVLMAVLENDIPAIRTGMLSTAATLEATRAAKMVKWFDDELARIARINGGQAEATVKKPETASQSHSSGTAASAVAGTSPPSKCS